MSSGPNYGCIYVNESPVRDANSPVRAIGLFALNRVGFMTRASCLQPNEGYLLISSRPARFSCWADCASIREHSVHPEPLRIFDSTASCRLEYPAKLYAASAHSCMDFSGGFGRSNGRCDHILDAFLYGFHVSWTIGSFWCDQRHRDRRKFHLRKRRQWRRRGRSRQCRQSICGRHL